MKITCFRLLIFYLSWQYVKNTLFKVFVRILFDYTIVFHAKMIFKTTYIKIGILKIL
jgi:hypothetical protein